MNSGARKRTLATSWRELPLIPRVVWLGLGGGAVAGALFGFGCEIFWSASGQTYDTSLGEAIVGGFELAPLAAIFGLVTGAAATGAFLLVWSAARLIRPVWLSRLLPALAAGAAITALFALLWLPPGPNVVGESFSFNGIALLGCVLAAAAYYLAAMRAPRG